MEVKLVVVGGKQEGMEIPVQGPEFLIGRGEECRLRPQSTMVSRKHCAILLGKDSAVLMDFGSINGTLINGERVQDRTELKNGDRIKIGVLEFDVRTSVSLVGKKKPKVNNVQEAAARTVAAATADDDLDISSWLKADDNKSVTAPIKRPWEPGDTTTNNHLGDTTIMTAEQTGQLGKNAKPLAENSREAAADMLKQFFPKKNMKRS
jgi:pSer/pThr/pTyr-binding forkhead associated (FHA) protein